MDEATWAKIATDNGVSADQWPMILDLAKTRRTLHPEQTRGFADDFELAAVLVSQRGDPSRPVSTTPFADKTTWPTRAENPAWHRSLERRHRNV